MPNPFRIFISYAKADTRDLAFHLRDAFNALPNVVAWMDESLESGEDWALQIQDEIDRADVVVVLLSPDVNRPANHPKGRSFVLKEIHYAQQVRKSILPVMAQQTRVPVQLAGVEYTDLTKDFAAGFSRLLQQISRRAGNPPPSPDSDTKPFESRQTERRLDAATPSQTKISTKTEIEVRVKVVRLNSGGLRDELPAVAISGDTIHKHNVVPSNFPIQFEEDDSGNLSAPLCIKLHADGFKVRSDFAKGDCGSSAVALKVSPNADSQTITFFLSPKAVPQAQSVHIRVSVLQKGNLIAQVTLQTELVEQVERISITDYWNLISSFIALQSGHSLYSPPSFPPQKTPIRPRTSDTVKVALIAGVFSLIAAFIAIVPNIIPKAAETPTQAAVIASNTPQTTDSPTITPLQPTPLPTDTPVPPSATTAPTNTPIPPTNTPAPPTSAPSQVQIVQQFAAPGGLPNGIACSANGLLLVDNSTAMFEINTSGKLLAVYQSPDPTPVGLGSDGTHFWVQTTNRGLIHEFQISGSQLSAGRSFESPVTVVGGTNDMAWDGSAWWIADQFNLHHLDSSGNRLNPLPFPKTIAGVDWDGTYLWLAFTASPTLSVYDRDGNFIQTFASPIPEVQGLAWCGTELWAIGRDQIGSPYQVYQLAVAGWQVSPLPTNTTVPPTPIVVTATPIPTVPPTATTSTDTYPCKTHIVSDQGTILSGVVREVPNGRVLDTISLKSGQAITLLQESSIDGWYEIQNESGLRLGWINIKSIVESNLCPPT